eukprot:4893242-Pyramimonas_sp.AAC.1
MGVFGLWYDHGCAMGVLGCAMGVLGLWYACAIGVLGLWYGCTMMGVLGLWYACAKRDGCTGRCSMRERWV